MAEARPILWLLAGPNGSGKSTFYQQKLAPHVPTYVNPDEIAKGLDIVEQPARDLRAMDLAEVQRHDLIAARETFVAETVFSHPSKVDLIREAKAAGYEVNLVFICTDNPTINLTRIENRVLLGGIRCPLRKSRHAMTAPCKTCVVQSLSPTAPFFTTTRWLVNFITSPQKFTRWWSQSTTLLFLVGWIKPFQKAYSAT